MARKSRVRVKGRDAFYHLRTHVAGEEGEFPLDKPLARGQLTSMMQWYSSAYCCDVAAFNVMGTHYHMDVKFEKFRSLGRKELMRRAKLMYPNSQAHLKRWKDEDWEIFEKRVFNVSELMRNLNGGFATWYNKQYQRKGHFWGDRFKSTWLTDQQQMQNCMLYIDLNPVRAGIVEVPGDWEGSSIFLRERGKDYWLTPLNELFPAAEDRNKDLMNYRARLIHRGSRPTRKNIRENDAIISQEILNQEIAAGFETPGAYLERRRYLIDGLIVGNEDLIQQEVDICRDKGEYKRRINPISQTPAGTYSLREQRSHAISF